MQKGREKVQLTQERADDSLASATWSLFPAVYNYTHTDTHTATKSLEKAAVVAAVVAAVYLG
jgi:hypothetical protein